MQYPCVIDSQRRLAIPKPWRLDTDTEETEFYVALGTGPSLEFYDYEEFEKRQRISRQNINTKEKRILNMGAGSLSMIVQLDKQGRFSIPQPMLEAAQIHTNVLCLGATNYATIIAVEIWDKIKPSLDEIISYNEMLSADNSVVNIETKVMVTETQ
jgi:DNA-binding transcriptional regulator/RsmH inhibitor MraZ